MRLIQNMCARLPVHRAVRSEIDVRERRESSPGMTTDRDLECSELESASLGAAKSGLYPVFGGCAAEAGRGAVDAAGECEGVAVVGARLDVVAFTRTLGEPRKRIRSAPAADVTS